MATRLCTMESNAVWATGGYSSWKTTDAKDSYRFYSGRTGEPGSRTYYRSRIRFTTPSYSGEATKIILKLTMNQKSSPKGLMGVLTERVELAPSNCVNASAGGGPASTLSNYVISTSSRAYTNEACTTTDERTDQSSGTVTYLKFECDSLQPNTDYDVYIMRVPGSSSTGYCGFGDNNWKSGALTATIHYTATYTLTLDVNNRSGATFTTVDGDTSVTVDDGTIVETIATAEQGYRLRSYNGTLSDGSGNSSWMPDNETQDYATWTMNANRRITLNVVSNVYTVTYLPNYGNNADSYTDSVVFDLEFSPLENQFSRTGYNFVGWNTRADGTGTTYNVGTDYLWDTPDNVSLYAMWEAKQFTIYYDPMGGDNYTQAGDTDVATYGEYYSTRDYQEVCKPYHTFVGWTTNPDGTMEGNEWTYTNGIWYGDYGTDGYAIDENDEVHLYAVWYAHQVHISYRLGLDHEHEEDGGATYCTVNGREHDMEHLEVLSYDYTVGTDESLRIEPNDDRDVIYMEKTGHINEGQWVCHESWSTDNSDGSQTSNPHDVVVDSGTIFDNPWSLAEYFGESLDRGDVVILLCPVWTPEVYEISFDIGGTVLSSKQYQQYNESISLLSYTPYRDGYAFLGWDTDSSASTVVYLPGDPLCENRDLTLYAVWELTIVPGYAGVYLKVGSEFKNGSTYVKVQDRGWVNGETVYFKVGGKWKVVQHGE